MVGWGQTVEQFRGGDWNVTVLNARICSRGMPEGNSVKIVMFPFTVIILC